MIRTADMRVERYGVTEYWTPITERDFQRRVAIERSHQLPDDVPVMTAAEISGERMTREQRIVAMTPGMYRAWCENFEYSDGW